MGRGLAAATRTHYQTTSSSWLVTSCGMHSKSPPPRGSTIVLPLLFFSRMSIHERVQLDCFTAFRPIWVGARQRTGTRQIEMNGCPLCMHVDLRKTFIYWYRLVYAERCDERFLASLGEGNTYMHTCLTVTACLLLHPAGHYNHQTLQRTQETMYDLRRRIRDSQGDVAKGQVEAAFSQVHSDLKGKRLKSLMDEALQSKAPEDGQNLLTYAAAQGRDAWFLRIAREIRTRVSGKQSCHQNTYEVLGLPYICTLCVYVRSDDTHSTTKALTDTGLLNVEWHQRY